MFVNMRNYTLNEVCRKTRISFVVVIGTIVNRGKWLRSPANINNGGNKEAKLEVGRSMTVHIFCFALIHYA